VRSASRTLGQPGGLPARRASRAPNGRYVEHIPQPGAITRIGPVSMDGWVRPPDAPGIGIDRDLDAADDLWVA
jgi:L-alanine-DL-glutamate epimerase-like enolase superfamily enzyme